MLWIVIELLQSSCQTAFHSSSAECLLYKQLCNHFSISLSTLKNSHISFLPYKVNCTCKHNSKYRSTSSFPLHKTSCQGKFILPAHDWLYIYPATVTTSTTFWQTIQSHLKNKCSTLSFSTEQRGHIWSAVTPHLASPSLVVNLPWPAKVSIKIHLGHPWLLHTSFLHAPSTKLKSK